MPSGSSSTTKNRIDALMEQASVALVARRYFETERLSLQALRRAHTARDYERMARILLPLQEARRLVRDIAVEAASRAGVWVVNGALPVGKAIRPGCYLICPPRVGVDGRALREAAERREVPVLITVREPTTQSGLWPIVAVGPVTVRAKVVPPTPPMAKPKSGRSTDRKRPPAKGETKPPSEASETPTADVLPTPEWFLSTNEALGDAAIASVSPTATAQSRVDALIERLEAVPDHEKLHQALAEAAREAAREATEVASKAAVRANAKALRQSANTED